MPHSPDPKVFILLGHFVKAFALLLLLKLTIYVVRGCLLEGLCRCEASDDQSDQQLIHAQTMYGCASAMMYRDHILALSYASVCILNTVLDGAFMSGVELVNIMIQQAPAAVRALPFSGCLGYHVKISACFLP